MTPDHPFSDAPLRAGDADRERVAAQLSRAHAEGRIDEDELSDRLGCCYAARTFAELDRLTVDLRALDHREPDRFDRYRGESRGHAWPGARRRRIRFPLAALPAVWAVWAFGAVAHRHAHAFVAVLAVLAVLAVAFAVTQLVRAVRA